MPGRQVQFGATPMSLNTEIGCIQCATSGGDIGDDFAEAPQASRAEHYRCQAKRLLILAETARFAITKRNLLDVARRYALLAEHVEALGERLS